MAGEARVKIGSKTYRAVTLDEMTLEDIIMLEGEAEDAGYGVVTYELIEQWAEAENGLTSKQAAILTAVTVWLMKRNAGENVSLKEAGRTPANSIKPLASPEDQAAPKARKRTAPKASALAAVPPADEPDEATPPTSEPQSASA